MGMGYETSGTTPHPPSKGNFDPRMGEKFGARFVLGSVALVLYVSYREITYCGKGSMMVCIDGS